ncbi:nickel pincer cofactor biosynthesis protein LarC [Clostridium formicaceticum]|uniref:Pyridinium-3,5-bisthiocarboxylic acid mononucleotide nickel insertion protein n=1 Tax=Clostridium formicaceticum TaxID=1497 RepID=A0AAC9RHP8_9CLOT|nr:nickel pincer cofactor biosynthesis protein LarC [Clostridium formicaceticum]AOY75917.1 TIGR00299 family protein [Clostridium formicaceticum]ARE86261.1 hypothetical protein CLFO_05830 [Clostridium formicaceticum]
MKILYYDCFSGISGDMNLGAMIDLGVDEAILRRELEKLHLNEYELVVTRDERKGITGTKVDVKLLHHLPEDHHHDETSCSHNHAHHHEHHCHDNHAHHHEKKHHHHHRNLHDIEAIIHHSDLHPTVKELSLEMFRDVAVAEAKIHGKPIEEVHFHEVGAVDSIVDIVGAAICYNLLKVDKVIFSPITVGGGFVNCAHGIFPVPAPATTEILKGIPIVSGEIQKEMTTPTGAVIAKILGDKYTSNKNFSITKVGYGIGHRDNAIPNVLRVFLGEADDHLEEKAKIIECNIDDMNPELYQYVMEKLLAEGAMDVYLTPITMKKSRPAMKLSVLCSPQIVDKMISILYEETTTLGTRSYDVDKSMMGREIVTVDTPYGAVRIKLALYKNKVVKWKAEYEDCKKIAASHHIPLKAVYELVEKLYSN